MDNKTPEQLAAEFKQQLDAAKAEAKAAKETAAEQSKQIANLDASIKAQQNTIEELKKLRKDSPKSFKAAIAAAMEEKKEDIIKGAQAIMDGKAQRLAFEVKLGTGSITPGTLAVSPRSLDVDPTVHATPILAGAFLAAFTPVASDAAAINWIEANSSKTVGYVAELANNANESSVSFTEKNRKWAKLATFLQFSSEIEAWFPALVEFAQNEVDKLLDKEADSLLWSGAGNDSSKTNEIYGISGQSTAFAGLGKYDTPTIADVITDAIAQVRKAGFTADTLIIPFADEAELRSIKDNGGNLIFNQYTGMLGQLKVYPTAVLSAGSLVVADSSVVHVKKGKVLEMELSRNAANDAWRVDFRRRYQAYVATPEQAAVIKVGSVATAIAAITKAKA